MANELRDKIIELGELVEQIKALQAQAGVLSESMNGQFLKGTYECGRFIFDVVRGHDGITRVSSIRVPTKL